MLILLILLFDLIYFLFGLNLNYYQVEIKATNTSNVFSFEECICKCLTYSDCSYFAYWSFSSLSFSLSECQIYMLDDKPEILNYNLSNNDNQTGLYGIPKVKYELSISTLLYNYSNNASLYIPMIGKRIISVLIMSIFNQSRLLAIDDTGPSYFIFNLNTLEIIDNGTFLSSGIQPLCTRTFSNLLYIGYTQNIIEVRQFVSIVNTSRTELKLLNTFSTTSAGPPQCLAILNTDVLYYVVGPNQLYVLLTRSNTSKHLYTFTGLGFYSPSVLIVLDSINMELFLANSNGQLFRIELSSINSDNGTSIVNSALVDQYQMSLNNTPTSLFLDKYNRLWAFSSPSGSYKLEILVFIRQENSSGTFSTMNIVNLTNFFPTFLYAPYNFELDNNYSLYTANANQGVSAFFRL